MNTDLSNAEIEASERDSAHSQMALIEHVAEMMKQGQIFYRRSQGMGFKMKFSADSADPQEQPEFEEALKFSNKGDYHNAGIMLQKAYEKAVLINAATYLELDYQEIKEALDEEDS